MLRVRFRRQAVILGWIADFYCPKTKLVVEVDGQGHLRQAQADKDKLRDAVMKDHGFRILRFTNNDVLTDLDRVVRRISSSCAQHLRLKTKYIRLKTYAEGF